MISLSPYSASAAVAKEAMDNNQDRLSKALAMLTDSKAKPTSSEKLGDLKKLQQVFSDVNPRNLEDNVKELAQQVEDLRAYFEN